MKEYLNISMILKTWKGSCKHVAPTGNFTGSGGFKV